MKAVAITFHEVIGEPLGRSAPIEIVRVASTVAGEARKQTNRFVLILRFLMFLFVCMFSRGGGLRRKRSLLSAPSLSQQYLPLSRQGPLDRFAVN